MRVPTSQTCSLASRRPMRASVRQHRSILELYQTGSGIVPRLCLSFPIAPVCSHKSRNSARSLSSSRGCRRTITAAPSWSNPRGALQTYWQIMEGRRSIALHGLARVDAIVGGDGVRSQPLRHPPVGLPAIPVAEAGPRRLLEPVVQVHSAQVVEIPGLH